MEFSELFMRRFSCFSCHDCFSFWSLLILGILLFFSILGCFDFFGFFCFVFHVFLLLIFLIWDVSILAVMHNSDKRFSGVPSSVSVCLYVKSIEKTIYMKKTCFL